ncbi:hypothetical protein [Streptomyces roseus]|uniref:Lipoprotein n=1 Tax=Streptomyces roseus TaxID=66430 RepID=A0A0J6XI87_9ACTN|nr:hypothetical protein [Streptomyces roseus]KMO94353.1 hypothetical protein ACS04_29915 [Streptomyces roseus]
MNAAQYLRGSRAARVSAVLLCSAALAACGGHRAGEAGDARPAAATTSFTEQGVTVTLTVSGWHGSTGTLSAVFTPERKGFHLYSTDLPADGVEGVGRPTAMTVSGAVRADGRPAASADVRSITVPGVEAPVPVYPDGPVTLTLPVRAHGNGNGDGAATVLLGYASCSTQDGCTIPVSGHPVHLNVTATGATFSPR